MKRYLVTLDIVIKAEDQDQADEYAKIITDHLWENHRRIEDISQYETVEVVKLKIDEFDGGL